MSKPFTKTQEEQIKKLITEALGAIVTGEDKRKDLPDFDKWEKECFVSSTGLKIAPEDFYIGNKKFFTWDEANEALKDTPWRLPTAAEWMMICGEFGADEDGVVTAKQLENNLGLKRNGWVFSEDMEEYNKDYSNSSIVGVGTDGNYWSASATTTAANAYYLYFYSGGVNPQTSYPKLSGFSIRCVAR